MTMRERVIEMGCSESQGWWRARFMRALRSHERAMLKRAAKAVREIGLGEGIHTAFRKASDSREANKAWQAIHEMDDAEWSAIVAFVADCCEEVILDARRER